MKNKTKWILPIVIISFIILAGTCAGIIGGFVPNLFTPTMSTNDSVITLNADNAPDISTSSYTSTGQITESHGVVFKYTNAKKVSGAHVELGASGVLYNNNTSGSTTQITSISSVSVVFSTSGTLSLLTSLDGSTYTTGVALTSGTAYSTTSTYPYYLKLASDSTNAVTITSVTINYLCHAVSSQEATIVVATASTSSNTNISSSIATTDFTCTNITLSAVSGSGWLSSTGSQMKFGSSSQAGSLTFTFDSALITKVVANVTIYGSDSTTVTVTTNGNGTSQGLTCATGNLEFSDFSSDTTASTTLTISSASGKRFYLNSLTITIGQATPVALTGISLPSTSTVSVGATKTLDVTFTPANATNKTVTWSITNASPSGCATINASTGLISGVSAGTATVVATSADGGYVANSALTVSAASLDAWTIMIYICGADLESGGGTSASSATGLATGDLTEIYNTRASLPDNVNIIVEAGGAKVWKDTYSSVISASKLNRFHLTTSGYVTDAQITKESMGLSSTLLSFLEWGLTSYPAEKTMVVFWDHGGGMAGCCYDENYDSNSLLNSEIQTALSGAFTATGRSTDNKLEVVGYDCCLMQVQDIAETNSTYFNYMMASEESESGYGWDYDASTSSGNGWLYSLYSNAATSSILTKCCDAFVSENGSTSDQTLSWLTLSNAAAYKTAWESMADALKSKITSSNKSSFYTLLKSCKYYADTDYLYFCLFDAKDFLTKLAASSTFNPGTTYTTACTTAHSNLVTYSKAGTGAGNSYGLALFFAVSSNASTNGCSYTSSDTNFTNWLYLNDTYGA